MKKLLAVSLVLVASALAWAYPTSGPDQGSNIFTPTGGEPVTVVVGYMPPQQNPPDGSPLGFFDFQGKRFFRRYYANEVVLDWTADDGTRIIFDTDGTYAMGPMVGPPAPAGTYVKKQ
jgi:hypothetical protein